MMKLTQQRVQLMFFGASRRNFATYQLIAKTAARSQLQASLLHTSKRSFGMPKYKFEDEDYEPNRFQVSLQD